MSSYVTLVSLPSLIILQSKKRRKVRFLLFVFLPGCNPSTVPFSSWIIKIKWERAMGMERERVWERVREREKEKARESGGGQIKPIEEGVSTGFLSRLWPFLLLPMTMMTVRKCFKFCPTAAEAEEEELEKRFRKPNPNPSYTGKNIRPCPIICFAKGPAFFFQIFICITPVTTLVSSASKTFIGRLR